MELLHLLVISHGYRVVTTSPPSQTNNSYLILLKLSWLTYHPSFPIKSMTSTCDRSITGSGQRIPDWWILKHHMEINTLCWLFSKTKICIKYLYSTLKSWRLPVWSVDTYHDTFIHNSLSQVHGTWGWQAPDNGYQTGGFWNITWKLTNYANCFQKTKICIKYLYSTLKSWRLPVWRVDIYHETFIHNPLYPYIVLAI